LVLVLGRARVIGKGCGAGEGEKMGRVLARCWLGCWCWGGLG
jgi:hypothetical protein